MVYTVTLNPALDYALYLPKLRYDDINRVERARLDFGGKGVNVSVVLKRLGVENKALGFAAGFTGAELQRLLEEEGVCCAFTQVERGATRINVKIKAETELDLNAPGPDVRAGEIETLLTGLNSIAAGDVLVLAGSIPGNLPADIYEQILQRLDGRGVRTVVDATGDLLLNVLKYKPFLIKPNHHELGDLFGVTTQTEEEIRPYAEKLREMGAQNVLVSRSKDGAVLLDEHGDYHRIGGVPGKPVNSVGSGDSMVAGFIAGYLQQGNYAHALKLGAACGTATAFSAGLAAPQDIQKIFLRL